MGDKIKSFLSYFFIGLMFLGLGALLFYLGIEGLTGRKNPSDVTSYLSEDDVSKWVTITVNEASPEILTVRHKALLVIPWGKDHFFFAASKDGVIVTVSADEDWYEKNFDKNGISKDKDGVILVGQVGSFFNAYELDSTNIKEMIEKQAEKIVLDESSFTSLTEVYIDTEES